MLLSSQDSFKVYPILKQFNQWGFGNIPELNFLVNIKVLTPSQILIGRLLVDTEVSIPNKFSLNQLEKKGSEIENITIKCYDLNQVIKRNIVCENGFFYEFILIDVSPSNIYASWEGYSNDAILDTVINSEAYLPLDHNLIEQVLLKKRIIVNKTPLKQNIFSYVVSSVNYILQEAQSTKLQKASNNG